MEERVWAVLADEGAAAAALMPITRGQGAPILISRFGRGGQYRMLSAGTRLEELEVEIWPRQQGRYRRIWRDREHKEHKGPGAQ